MKVKPAYHAGYRIVPVRELQQEVGLRMRLGGLHHDRAAYPVALKQAGQIVRQIIPVKHFVCGRDPPVIIAF